MITRIWQWLLASSPNEHEPGKHEPCLDNLLKKAEFVLIAKKKKKVGLNKGQISEKEIVFGRSPVRCFQNFGWHGRLDGWTSGRMDR